MEQINIDFEAKKQAIFCMQKGTIKLRDYQQNIYEEAINILNKYGLVYLALETRLGKTFIAAFLADKFLKDQNQSFLFVTKKKAIPNIKENLEDMGLAARCKLINYESVHKVKEFYPVIILDEAHRLGSFPKKCKAVKVLERMTRNSLIIYLSATPTPESLSQIYHQLQLSSHSPFTQYANFYKFARKYVDVKQKKIKKGLSVNDYSNARESLIMPLIAPLTIKYTQEQAGFPFPEIDERIEFVKMNDNVKLLSNILLKHSFYQSKLQPEYFIDIGSAADMQNKIHQISSGSVIFKNDQDEPEYMILDEAKGRRCKQLIKGKKTAIFYKFIGEKNIIESTLDQCNLTNDPIEFESNKNCVFYGQIQAVKEGIKLKSAEQIIFFNISFSWTDYAQAKNRLQDMHREHPPKLIWLFSEDGIEQKIYKRLMKKKSFTTIHFRADYDYKYVKKQEQQ
ncbi:MAG: hypothetical protein DRQ46_00410 [Gammaproteobacteria bacterium]|nr:MAG: hypothetical protein DRQ46_00410 [Gammaproteobacteria bacterium]